MLPSTALSDPRHERFAELKNRLSAASSGAGTPLEGLVSSTVSAIDLLLGGGFPAGALITLEGPASSGRWSLAAALLAVATRRGLGAVIDGGELYPPSLEAAGVRLDRLLIVPAKTPAGIARAADVLLRSRVARIVVMPVATFRAAVWSRLAGLAQRAGALLVVVATRVWPELSASATVRLGFAPAHAIVRGAGPWGILEGFDARADLRKHKFAPCGARTTFRSCAR
jgi:hypothetical protein